MKQAILSVFIFSLLLSQESPKSSRWGMEFGLNYNQVVSKNLNDHSKFLPSANLMVFYDIPSGNVNSLLIGLRLADNAAKLQVDQFFIQDLILSKRQQVNYIGERDFHVLMLGVNFRYIYRFLKIPIYFSGGTEAGVNIYPVHEYDEYAIEMNKILNRFNLSINVGTGYDISLGNFNSYIHLGYLLGLTSVFNYNGEDELWRYHLSDDLKNRTIIINFGFYF